MRGSASSLDRPSTLPITRFREGHSPPFHDVLVSCLVLSSILAWVLRCYGWKVGSSLVFGVLIVVLANLEVTLINGQLWTLKGAPLVRFSPFPSILISSSLRLNTTTHPTSPYTLTVMSQQTHAFPYQRPVFHPRPVPFPPPYQRVANHSYGLRPRVAPIRGYGPVPRPSPVHPAANVPARQSGFVQRPLTPMPVTGNGPFLSSKATRFQPASCGFYASNPERAFPIGYGIKLLLIWWPSRTGTDGEYPGSSVIDGESNRSPS
ncbi:hypothetical protein PSTG_07576 [Puccinia striiformis f. sp. tritici PST-78]|uniref:Uncharacterized protein n=1 Tax=Puccinia striiformis f. sp. tritici PST-78 TaxID=1165861 RepID=A0A0L0VIR2_9BASI|nr:hypothetical protein PSTG_07576 [Puccinia striiformis f. sp. tritici PST-78]